MHTAPVQGLQQRGRPPRGLSQRKRGGQQEALGQLRAPPELQQPEGICGRPATKGHYLWVSLFLWGPPIYAARSDRYMLLASCAQAL